jgi:3'-phosphoadenosine 5'-phosphosulfate sulfotransferase (PAPS reductase)/FAD synthetase
MTALLSLPQIQTEPAREPDIRDLLPLSDYDVCLVSFSGGKDSLALVLDLLERGVQRDRIQLWHQCVDGEAGVDQPFADWPCTESYVRAVGKALGIRVLFQSRLGGFLNEMLKQDARTRAVRFDRQDGSIGQAGGLKGKLSTRRKFPQASGDLRVRWCSAVLKIDVMDLALNNEPAFKNGTILVLTGERREESANRARYAELEPHRCDCRRRRVDTWRSVIDWSEEQVWKIMERWRIQPHPAYRLGFPRVSCMTCIFGGADQWASVRKLAPDRFPRIVAYEREFGCTIKQGMTIEQLADRGTPYPACDDAALVKLAMSSDYPADQVFVPDEQPWMLPSGANKRGGGPV